MDFGFWETRIVICCALQEEIGHVKTQFDNWVQSFSGWFISEDYPTCVIRFECFDKMGPEVAAAHTKELIHLYKPSMFILCGIMGGFTDRGVKEGDVVIGKRVIGYDQGKLTNVGKQQRWEVYPQPAALCGIAACTFRGIRKQKVHTGDIFSGKSVWATKKIKEVREIKKAWDKALGVEMEALGMCIAIYETNVWNLPALIVIKGVSDKAAPDKVDNTFRRTAAENAGKVAKVFIDRIGKNKKFDTSYVDVDRRLKSLEDRLVRSFHKSGYFIENLNNPRAYTQQWTTADVALGVAHLKDKDTSNNIKNIIKTLLKCNIPPGGYSIEQFPVYPMTVVTSTIGIALHYIGCLSSGKLASRALAGYERVLKRLRKMRINSTAWSFCELAQPNRDDMRVWDSVYAVYCCLCDVAAGRCSSSTTNLAGEMAEEAIKWLHSIKRNDGWFNRPTEGNNEVSLILTVIVSALITLGSVLLRKDHLSLDELFIKKVLLAVSSEKNLLFIEKLKAEDAKLSRHLTDPDYGRVVEKSTLLLTPALCILSQALDKSNVVSAETRNLSRYLARSVLHRSIPEVEGMSLYAPALVLQGLYIWKHYLEMANEREL